MVRNNALRCDGKQLEGWYAPDLSHRKRDISRFNSDLQLSLFMPFPPPVEDPLPMSWDFSAMNMTMMMGMNLTKTASMMVEVVHDLSAVLDGVPYVLNPTGTDTDITQPGMVDSPAILSSVQFAYMWLPFCSTPVNLVGKRFNHLWYDPSISVLFSGSMLSPDATPGQKADKTKFIILAVCLVAAVGLIITAFLIAWFHSPSLRTFFRPYRKRKLGVETRDDAVNGVSAENPAWSRSSQPIDSI